MQQLYLSRSQRGGISSLTILVLVMLGIFLALGTWQLQRKAEKESILKDARAGGEAAVGQIPLGLQDYSEWRYREVVAAGEYLNAQQFLLDNQIRDRVVGYNVLTPLQLKSGDFVLVDRGWLPQQGVRSSLPAIEVDASEQTVKGSLYTPFSDGLRLGAVDNGTSGWPRVIQYIDYQQLTEQLEKPLLSVVLRLDPGELNGYRRDWQIVAFSPERHLGYAVQWYGLAAAMFIIFIILVRKKIE